jgi:hypothetical protein
MEWIIIHINHLKIIIAYEICINCQIVASLLYIILQFFFQPEGNLYRSLKEVSLFLNGAQRFAV